MAAPAGRVAARSAAPSSRALPVRFSRFAFAAPELRRQPKPTGHKSARRSAEPSEPVLASLPAPGNASVDRSYGGGLSCVPYVRMVTGMQVSGNGGTWWNNAAGLYQRGSRPEPGSVLVFRSSGGMRAGHVAVVERQVSAREITIHHSNWGGPGIRRGTVTRNVSVMDVSPGNDWTAVRVQTGLSSENYGRTYATYGFIFNRPEGGSGRVMQARVGRGFEEVAEGPASPHLRFINTAIGGLGVESAR
ncbi:CHAP domain-containing protein [Muricoccus radiodurans]|uniref:CHAP domain-containing protein n=1 Tax=Muricoccus radiodurans TaxID=2231721 RepID=UPI003CFAAB19